jgi:hypothetical protein
MRYAYWGVTGAGLIGGAASLFAGGGSIAGDVVSSLVLIAAIALSSIFLASVFDWFWVLPRITGRVRPAPWESSHDREWVPITRIWLLSRSIASVVVTLAVAAVPVVIGTAASGEARTAWLAVSGIVFSALLPANEGLRQVLHTSVAIGDLVHLEGRPGLVVDVSLQGAGVVYLDEPPRFTPSGAVRPDGVIALGELSATPRLEPSAVASLTELRASAFARQQRRRPASGGLGFVDPLDETLDQVVASRERIEQRNERVAGAGVLGVVGATTAGVAAAVAQIVGEAGHVLTLASVTGAMLGVGALTRGVFAARRQWRARRSLRSTTSPSPELQRLGGSVAAQRLALRTGLTREANRG